MEILYVWIQEYKNIINQGFNLSSKYLFDFDINTGTLLMEENKNYWSDFFPEGVRNVTALIGENGAGKTNFLRFLLESFANGATAIDFSCIIIYRVERDIKLFKNMITVDPASNFLQGTYSDLTNLTFINYSPLFNPNADYSEGDPFYTVADIKNRVDLSTNHLISADYNHANLGSDFSYSKDAFHDYLKIHKSKEIQRQLRVVLEIPRKLSEKIISFQLPTQLVIRISKNVFKEESNFFKDEIAYIRELKYEENQRLGNILLDYWKSFLWAQLQIYENGMFSKQVDIIKELLRIIISSDVPDPIVRLKSFWKHNYNVTDIVTIESMESFFNLIEQYWIKEMNTDPNSSNDNFNNTWPMIFSIKDDVDFLENFIRHYYKIIILFDFLEFEWQRKKEMGVVQLSTGEYTLLNFFSRLYDASQKDIVSNLILLIDEGELGFHPQWQKEYIDNILSVLPVIFTERNIQIIITSHSPFMASDLPRENIIFLRKGVKEDGDLVDKCIVVKKGDRKYPDLPQTFGQNIHTLFSDSFFMEGGLIGDFAKNKINTEIIEVINKHLEDRVKMSIEKINEIDFKIQMIGEPLIRRKLMSMLEEVIGISEQNTQIEYYQNKIDQLRNNQ